MRTNLPNMNGFSPANRIMDALGSTTNRAVMSIVIKDMNIKKEHVSADILVLRVPF